MKRPGKITGYLLDIEGVLVRDKRYTPVAGAVDWLRAVDGAGVPWCLVSNNTTHPPALLAADLAAAGFPVTEDRLVGVLDLGRRWLLERGRRRILWLGTPDLAAWWADAGCEPVAADACDAVVLGASTTLTVADLDGALDALVARGADLVCLHRNPFFLDGRGRRRLGPGAWAAALEAATAPGCVITVGKPSEKIYHDAVKRIGVDPDELLFISDDPVNDLVTAGRLGMATAFVLSGKYPDHGILARLTEDEWPDLVCGALVDVDGPGVPRDLPRPGPAPDAGGSLS